MNELVYDKKYHYWDSVSVFLDIDSLIYILVMMMIFWGITRIICRVKKKEKISVFDFIRKYMIISAIPIFLLFAVSLIMSGLYIRNNIIIAFLPLVYGVIIQVIFMIIGKIKKNKY